METSCEGCVICFRNKKETSNVAILVTDYSLTVEFTDKICFLKNKISREVVLLGTLRDGLYCLSPVSKSYYFYVVSILVFFLVCLPHLQISLFLLF